jgi:hypothetical protein
MAFYFKGDQLFAKRADVSENQMDNWTSFLMDLREPMEMPDFEQFSKFLTTSMVKNDTQKVHKIGKKTKSIIL